MPIIENYRTMACGDSGAMSSSGPYSCAVCTSLVNWTSDSKTSDILSTFSAYENDSPKTSPLARPPCSICLNILEHSFSERVIDEVIRKFTDANYDADSFNLAVTLPPSCFLLEKVARLRNGSENGFSSDEGAKPSDHPLFTFSLKDACRLCYQTGIEQKLASRKIVFSGQSDFTVAITFENSKADSCCGFLQRWFPDRFTSSTRRNKRRWVERGTSVDGNNAQWSRTAIMDVLPSLTSDMIKEFDTVGPLRDYTDECSFSIGLTRTPLFIGGRYCKYSRYLTQTPWVVDGVRRGNSSVQELICEQLTKAVGAEDVKFTSSGREDTDVRMLGSGRPFAIQLVNCRRKRTLNQPEIDALQSQTNSATKDISVFQLRIVSDQEFAALKLGEEHKKKTYVALIWSPASLIGDGEKKRILDLQSLGPIELEQKTPIRVLHRRPLAVRRRTVENFGVTILGEHYFQLRLTTQAGTYVKEFVHGDFGRTRPSLSDLLGSIPVDILELDVEHIDLVWP